MTQKIVGVIHGTEWNK